MSYLGGQLAHSEDDSRQLKRDNQLLLIRIGKLESEKGRLIDQALTFQSTINKMQSNKSAHEGISGKSYYMDNTTSNCDPIKPFDHSHSATYTNFRKLGH